MENKEIETLTIKTPVYHPIFGKGELKCIEPYKLIASFKGGPTLTFAHNGIVGTDHFLSELYLTQIKIVAQ